MDPFSKKDWYDVKAPSSFSLRTIGKTLVTRTQGTKVRYPRLLKTSLLHRCAPAGTHLRDGPLQIASEGLKGRVFECNLADLQSVRLNPLPPCFPCMVAPPPGAIACVESLVERDRCAVQNEADAYRKIRLRAEDVQGRNVLTNFWVRESTVLWGAVIDS